MDFTREPVVETVITPKEGCKLVVRSSKGAGHEEFFVDSVEVVSFGHAQFYRSLEKPKNFLLPVIDYEVLEVREARMVLKHVVQEKASIKIGGGRNGTGRGRGEGRSERGEGRSERGEGRSDRGERSERSEPRSEPRPDKEEEIEEGEDVRVEAGASDAEGGDERGGERKRDRRRNYRRRRTREDKGDGTGEEGGSVAIDDDLKRVELPKPHERMAGAAPRPQTTPPEVLRTLLAPPPLISETISRYKEDFSQAFFSKEEEQQSGLSGEGAAATDERSAEEGTSDNAESRKEEGEGHPQGQAQGPADDLWNFSEEFSSRDPF